MEDPTTPARYGTVGEMFLARVAETPDRDAFYYPELPSEEWKTLKWKEVDERVRAISGGLMALGIDHEERVAILSATRVEWVLADIGILCAGAATTTIYPSNTPEECAFILVDSETRIVIAEDDSQVDKLIEVRDQIPHVFKVVTLQGSTSDDGWVITLKALEAVGRDYNRQNPTAFTDRIAATRSDHLATLIYTSGTTGMPKGVELLHDCWTYTGEGMEALAMFEMETERQFLWLPMSHSFGKVLEAAVIQMGIPTAVDGRIPKIVENLSIIKPTFMAAAPRIFEKVYNKVVTGAQDSGGVKLRIFRWSLDVGRQVSAIQQKGGIPGPLLELKRRIADRLVFSKLRELFGGRIRFFISGSAPLSRDMAEFFHAAGILICEGYGLTESSAASVVNTPENFRFGTVGKPLPGTEVKIAEDGEILLRSRGVMRGYRGLEQTNAETLQEGWLLTGDIGEVDSDGFLRITDRKKDLIKTSGGKYVAPQALESRLKALCPYLSQVLVHGNTRNFCSALVTLDAESIPKWAEDHGLEGRSLADLSKEPAVIELVQQAVNTLNGEQPSYSTIKRFAVLEREWSIEEGELTPSLKVKRKAVESNNKAVLDGFYSGTIKAI